MARIRPAPVRRCLGLLLLLAPFLLGPPSPALAQARPAQTAPAQPPPPEPGPVVLEDPLTAPGVLSVGACPNNKAIREATPDGYLIRLSGLCGEASSSVSTGASPRELTLPDGEVRVELRALRGVDRARVWLWLRNSAGRGYLLQLEPAARRLELVRVNDAERIAVASAGDLAAVDPTGWNTLVVRLRGPSFWVLLNGKQVLTATDATFDSGAIALGATRTGPLDDEAEVAVVMRNLRVAGLAGGPQARQPVFRPIATTATQPPPAPGQVVLEDALTSPGLFQPGACSSGQGDWAFSPDGFRIRLAGRCTEAANSARVSQWISGLNLPDGELRFEARFAAGADVGRLRVAFRARPNGSDRYYALLDLRSSASLTANVDGDVRLLASRTDLGQVYRQDDWNTIALRAAGSTFWLLINDQPVLSASDPTYDAGGVIVSLLDLARAEDQRESVLLLRNLRVSSLAGGDLARVPTYSRTTIPLARPMEDSPPPPAVGGLLLEDPLNGPGLLYESTCPTGRGSSTFVPEGLRIAVSGRCIETSPATALARLVQGLEVPDGEIRLEVKLLAGNRNTRFRLSFRSDERGANRYFLTLAPGAASLWRSGADGVKPLAVAPLAEADFPVDAWNSLAVRFQDQRIWVLLNDQPLMYVTDSTQTDGGVLLSLDRGGEPDRTDEAVVLVRNLRVSALADSPAERAPSYVGLVATPWRFDPAAIPALPVAGDALLEDALTSADLLEELSCQSGRAGGTFSPSGYQLSVAGPCDRSGLPAALAPIVGLDLPDGELSVEFKLTAAPLRANLAVALRLDPDGGGLYLFWLEPATGAAGLVRATPDGVAVLAQRSDLLDRLSLDDWNSLVISLRGEEIWVSLNDQAILYANDRALESGGVAFGLARIGPFDDEPTGVLLRNLRVAPLDGWQAERSPRLVDHPAPVASGTLPEVGNAVVEDPLTTPGFLLAQSCPTGRGGSSFQPEGVRLRVAGPCQPDQAGAFVESNVEGIRFRDADIRVELQFVNGRERSVFRVFFRGQGRGAYVLSLLPDEGYLVLDLLADGHVSTLAERDGLNRFFPTSGWTALGLRLEGQNIWVLLNDEPVLSIADSTFDGGTLTFQLARWGDINNGPEVVALARNLRISALRGSLPARAPILD